MVSKTMLTCWPVFFFFFTADCVIEYYQSFYGTFVLRDERLWCPVGPVGIKTAAKEPSK